MPTWILEQELADPIVDRPAPPDHRLAIVLVRQGGLPIGTVRVPCEGGVLRAAALRAAVVADPGVSSRLAWRALRAWLLGGPPDAPAATTLPSWSVVVCTRERPDDLRRCLGALARLDAPPGEIVVVDNAPVTDDTAGVVVEAQRTHPGPHRVRYIREDRPGLNWARTAGARAAAGDIVAYTDDDVVVDAQWIRTMLVEFAADPEIAAVTGPALALELQSEAQEIFEFRGGFVRGWDRRVYDGVSVSPLFAGMVGAGANVAFRREVLHELRPFSHELDAGTVAESGGDTYAFYLLLSHGRRIAYTPAALVWHRHRRDMPGLARVMHGYSVGGLTMLLRCLVDHRELTALKVAGQWLWRDHVHELARALLRRQTALPGHVVRAYWHGVFAGAGAGGGGPPRAPVAARLTAP
jgi:glycosyltransferase involved in cell wall biosynthesis